MTRQQIFDAVVEHFIKQGAPAVIQHGASEITCCYRTPDGLKCAIGALIPDELYTPEMEGAAALVVLRVYPLAGKAVGLSKSNEKLFEALQEAHDAAATDTYGNSAFLPRLWVCMRRVAEDFKLNTSKIPGDGA